LYSREGRQKPSGREIEREVPRCVAKMNRNWLEPLKVFGPEKPFREKTGKTKTEEDEKKEANTGR